MKQVIDFFVQGGFFMYPILLVGLVGIVIAVERAVKLFRTHSPEFLPLWEKIETCIRTGQIAEALRVAEATPTIYGRLARAGLSRSTRDEQQIQNSLDVATMKIVPELKGKLHQLPLIANVSTLLGLLGTISGLIQAFAAVAQADPAQKQVLLANGIAIAMNTTMFGLLVAIPTLMVHGWLSGRARKITISVAQLNTQLLDALSGRLFDWMESDRTIQPKTKEPTLTAST